MKQTILLLVAAISFGTAFAQTSPYYFIRVAATGKAEVAVAPEDEVIYADIDSLLVEERKTNKKGFSEVKGKRYPTYSALFRTLNEAGLEFVEFASLPVQGGITGSNSERFMIWKRTKP